MKRWQRVGLALVQHQEDALYLPMPDGTFQLLMECPRGGQFDYFRFP